MLHAKKISSVSHQFSSVIFSNLFNFYSPQFLHLCCCSVAQAGPTLWFCRLQHARLPCPSPSPGVSSDSSPLSWWCHPTISSSVVPFSSYPQSFRIRVFHSESVLCIRWPEYWNFSFSISFSNEYSGLISFRIGGFDLLVVQGTLKSLLQHQSPKASILWCSAFFIVQLSYSHMATKKSHSFD